jgi:hypothetical protein
MYIDNPSPEEIVFMEAKALMSKKDWIILRLLMCEPSVTDICNAATYLYGKYHIDALDRCVELINREKT